ncbi:MAG TPA: flagellar hook-associated protein FlgL [Firmicutes bacterium]|nr:flagellar hook-associated protein FlgL [Bacillota bacterium]
MRITSQMMVNNFVANLHRNLAELNKEYEKLASGKKFQRPGDDPSGVTRSMTLQAKLLENAQYARNIDEALAIFETSEIALNNVSSVLARARDLTIRAGGLLADEDRGAIAKEVSGLIQQLVAAGNVSSGTKYVFGGKKVGTVPFQTSGDSVVYVGTTDVPEFEISPYVRMKAGVSGHEVFYLDDDTSLFDVLKSLEEALVSNPETIDDCIGSLDRAIDHVLRYRAEIGAKYNHLTNVKERLKDIETNLKALLSNNEDTDIAETIMQAKTKENVYTASLATGARIIQPSLVDFLR